MTTTTILEACFWLTMWTAVVGTPMLAVLYWSYRREQNRPPARVDPAELAAVAADLALLSRQVRRLADADDHRAEERTGATA